MGKGKRNKAKRKINNELSGLSKTFDEANMLSKLPAYDEDEFLREFEASGFKFEVFRRHTYLKARKDPNKTDPAIEAGIVRGMEQQNIVVDDDDTMKQLQEK